MLFGKIIFILIIRTTNKHLEKEIAVWDKEDQAGPAGRQSPRKLKYKKSLKVQHFIFWRKKCSFKMTL